MQCIHGTHVASFGDAFFFIVVFFEELPPQPRVD